MADNVYTNLLNGFNMDFAGSSDAPVLPWATPTTPSYLQMPTTTTAATVPASFTTPDINSAFLKGWKPTGNQYLDYNTLISAPYGLPSDWVTANYPTIQSSYDAWLKANTPAPTPGVFDPVIANPDKYATTSGLPDDVATALKDYLSQATGSLSGYTSTLNSLLNPANFSKAYKPVYEEMIQKTINGLNSKGMVNSTVAKDALAKTGDNVTSQYLQQLLNVASQFNNASSLPVSIAQALSKSTNPMSGWQFVKDLFDQTMA